MNDAEATLQPDSVLPCQVPDLASWPTRAHWGRVERDPYRKLVLAVLERAMMDARGRDKWGKITIGGRGRAERTYQSHQRALAQTEAKAWFASRSEAVMSYRWCCLMLGYEPPNIAFKAPSVPQERFSGPGVGQCP